jgi:serine/threonine-protein kinase
MSPEQFTGQPVDVRSDIYALGVMTYEMLVGKYPFEANTAWEWASKHMTEAPRPIETQALGQHVPERMRHAITRALAKNKDERYPSVKEFYEALSGGGMPNQTAVMNQSQSHGTDPNAAPLAANRPKTEMGAPVDAAPYGGPPAGAMTPPYGGAGMGPGMGTAGPAQSSAQSSAGAAVVPQGPMHAPAKKGGGSGLIIGLGALAVLLIGGGILAFALRGKPKPVNTGDPLADLNATTDASTAPVETAVVADVDAGVTGATPLGGPVVTAAAVKTGTGTAGTKPTASAKPVPTPTPQPKVDPPICVVARNAAKSGRPTAAGLAAQCKAAGGTP